jgi:hypothetical protein
VAKISELIKILRGEGNVAGARRAERIGDEAPYSLEGLAEKYESARLPPVQPFGKGSLVKGKKLSERAREGLTEYQSGLYNSKVGGYSTLQNYLRTGGTKKYGTDYDEETLKKIVEGIDEAFIGSRLAGGTKLYRGLNDARALFGANLENLQVGKVLNDPGFLSTTKSKKIAQEKFSKKLNPGERPYILEIDIPSDMPGFDMSQFKDIGEQEVLLPRNLPLEVTDIRGGTIKVRPVVDQKMHGGMVQAFSGGGLAKFFSAVDEAVANLRQKKGTGEQMLKEIQKAPGVKKEELELRRLPERLAGQQKVTQEDIQAMLQAVPAPKLSMTTRGGKAGLQTPDAIPDFQEWLRNADRRMEHENAIDAANMHGFEVTQNPEDMGMLGFLDQDGDIYDSEDVYQTLIMSAEDLSRDYVEAEDLWREASRKATDMIDWDGNIKPGFEQQYEEAQRKIADLAEDKDNAQEYMDNAYQAAYAFSRLLTDWGRTISGPSVSKDPKFENFTTKGPKENYRELLIQLDRPDVQDPTKPYVKPAHFSEEDIVVHARVDDRVGPNGEKILYVEEIQSDWHQDARKARLDEAKNRVDKGSIQAEISDAAMAQMREELGLPGDAVIPSAEDSPEVRQRFLEVFEELEDARINEEAKKLPKDFGYKEMGTRIPPWQQTSHELAIKQIFDTAAREGYDKVMFAPGSEQVKRYSLGEYLDEIKVSSRATSSGTVYDLEGLAKDGRTIDRTFKNKKELAEHIGDDKAKMALERIAKNKASGSKKPAVLTGEDLLLGGKKAQGKLKIYDEILPNYVQKYAGKEFNVQPGKTSIDADNISMSDRRHEFAENFLDRRRRELRRSFDEGVIPAGAEDIEGEILEEARKVVLKGFQPGYSTLKERFAEKFAPKFNDDLSELGGSLKTDYQGLINELDPSSFRDNATERLPFTSAGEALDWLDPGNLKFRDPEKQGLYEDWLEEQIMEASTRPFVMDKVLIPRFRKMAEDELAARGEDFYKDMELPPRLEGMSVDITPEMREKITSRGQPLFVVPPAAAGAAALTEEEEPVQEFKEAGRVEKKEGLAKEQFASPFDETRRIGPRPGLGSGPARIRNLTKILRGEDSEAKNVERQRIAGNVKAGEEFGEYMYDMLVPQTPWEFALEAAFGPVGKLRKGLLAASGAMYDPDAEAGRIRLLHGSPSKIDRLEEGRELWASTDPEYALKRAMDKMRFAQGAQGPGYLNQFEMEDTDLMRLVDKYSPEEIEVARRAFAKLPQGREVTGEEIYELASTNTGGAKTAALENVARALGKKGYQVPAGADDKGEWYRVLDQTDLERFGRGGKVVDVLKDAFKMTDEAPDLSRRKAIGLREKIIEPGSLTTIEKEVSASDLETLQKAMGNVGEAILNEPVNRREVLKRGALSAGSNLIPGGGALTQIAKEMVPKMLDVTEPALGSKAKVGITPTIQGAIARALREGVDDELEIVDQLLDEFPDIDADELIDFVIPAMRDPYGAVEYGSQVAAMGPLEYLNRSLGYPGSNELRPILREIKDTDFLLYNQLKEAARRNDEMIAERTPGTTYARRLKDARAMAKKGGYPFNMEKFRERYGYPKDFDPNAPKKRKKKAD